MSEISDLAGEALIILDRARFIDRATDNDLAWSEAGSIADYLHQILDLSTEPVPTPTPPPMAQFIVPVPNGAIYGKTKWLPGSLGCDLFLPRGSVVVAPAECVIEEIIGGYGISGGAEMILSLPDKSWAWRYRHIATFQGMRVGMTVRQGLELATINDASLDQLGKIPAWAVQQSGGVFPDGWQHLDLSVNRGTDQFAPTGGGGGNVSAYQWLVGLGYTGIVLARTPGPPDAGYGFAESVTMMGRK